MSSSHLSGTSKSFVLPEAPTAQTGAVKAWSEPVTMASVLPPAPDKNPVFTDRKSKAQAYPLPFLEPTGSSTGNHSWQCIHIENEFLRLMIMPELGGRVHLAVDKLSGREILYRDEVVNATGCDLAGGLDVHFPADSAQRVYTKVATHIEEQADGSRTVWCSAYDPSTRVKGMHGICLYPGRAYIELKARLFNGTSFSHRYNWSTVWAVPVPEGDTVSVFPDSTSERTHGFIGTYSSEQEAGIVQVFDGHLSGGQSFTAQPEAVRLRTSMYSGLPPRVGHLAPSETKAFSQYWFPFASIGSVQNATVDAAVHLSFGDVTVVGVAVTRAFPSASVVLEAEGKVLQRWTRDLLPGRPLLEEANLPADVDPGDVTLKVLTPSGRELVAFTAAAAPDVKAEPAGKKKDPVTTLVPRKVATIELLYRQGLRALHDSSVPHTAEEYWLEALRRDPQHPAASNGIGLIQLQRGEFGQAESRFRDALKAHESGSTDADDGELFYNLGVALRFQERDEEAYSAFQRAAWNFAWRAPSLHAAAELECRRGNYGVVPKFLYEALRLNADNNNARSLAVVLFRRFGRAAEAEQLIRESLTLDPLDPWACHLAGRPFPGDNQVRLDLAFTYMRAGLYELAVELLTGADTFAKDGSLPMVHYTLASLYMRLGDLRSAQREYQAAASTQSDFCFPHRLEEMMVLARAIALQPEDARAQYYLGCLLYSYELPLQALEIWESSAKLNENFPTVWRNLALGYYNVTGNSERALDAFDRAVALDATDARVIFERDQLWQRLGVPPTLRFAEIQGQERAFTTREDLALELARLYNTNGEPENARELFISGKLPGWQQNPRAVDQYLRTFIKLGRTALANGESERARDLFLQPLSTAAVFIEYPGCVPKSVELQFWVGEAMNAAGHREAALTYWQKAINLCHMSSKVPAFSEATFFVALALGRVGDRQASRKLLRELWFAGRRLGREKPSSEAPTDGFKDNTVKQLRVRGLLWQAQARIGLGQYRLAGRLLEQLLTLDPNHDRGLDLISDLESALQSK